MLVHRLSQDLAEVCGYGQVAALVELGLIEAGPSPVDFAAFDWATHYEHNVGVAASGAAELGHGHDDRIFGQIAEIGPECGERLRELVENVGNLALGAAFVDVMVPA